MLITIFVSHIKGQLTQDGVGKGMVVYMSEIVFLHSGLQVNGTHYVIINNTNSVMTLVLLFPENPKSLAHKIQSVLIVIFRGLDGIAKK